MRRRAMTLLEILMVVIIVGILATVGLVNYTPIKEQRMQKMAGIALKYIQAAEELYQVEYRHYTTDTLDNSDMTAQKKMNDLLRLSLEDNQQWTYKVDTTVAPYTITAVRTGKNCTATLVKGADVAFAGADCQ